MPEVLDNISCDIAPVADSHLANKAYVDAAVAGNGTASVSGDNVVSIPAQALISCAIAPTENSHLANKAYVDAAVAAAGTATPVEEPAGLGKVVIVNTLSDAASHTGTSLRDAINAVASNGNVLIKFSVSGTITLEQGEITTTGNIAIDGENKITISGGGVSRIFYIAANPAAGVPAEAAAAFFTRLFIPFDLLLLPLLCLAWRRAARRLRNVAPDDNGGGL